MHIGIVQEYNICKLPCHKESTGSSSWASQQSFTTRTPKSALLDPVKLRQKHVRLIKGHGHVFPKLELSANMFQAYKGTSNHKQHLYDTIHVKRHCSKPNIWEKPCSCHCCKHCLFVSSIVWYGFYDTSKAACPKYHLAWFLRFQMNHNPSYPTEKVNDEHCTVYLNLNEW
jgi:hypothetical protein